MSTCHDVGEQACGTAACIGSANALVAPTATASPEVKHFLLWLHANGYTHTWQAYDNTVRDNYRRALGASADHMHEVARVLADPYFGITQCRNCGNTVQADYTVSSDGVVLCPACTPKRP